jgi:cation:H+ antiporter
MLQRLRHPLVAFFAAVALSVPWLAVWATGDVEALAVLSRVAVSGVAILGGSFLLAWGAETAEKDVPRAFAIAVLAVLAVAPEYAVDALYAWGAGTGGATAEACAQFTPLQIENEVTALAAACHDANLAVANMTGANRILIGLGWSGIALFTLYRAASAADPAVEERDGLFANVVNLDRSIAVEIAFLLAATAFAFLVPLGAGIGVVDTLVLVGLYVIYIGIAVSGEVEEVEEQVGVPAYFHGFPRAGRVVVSISLFVFAGGLIFTAVHPFATGLEHLGQDFGIPAFFMIQWVAPLASESPELIVVAYLVNKARSTAGFNALVSSKLNQWTLLIGTLAVVYSIAIGGIGTLPFDARQSAEIWITAAQSFFAIGVLINFSISGREALVLLVLFLSQVLIEFALIREWLLLPVSSHDLLLGYTAVYLALGAALVARRRAEFVWVMGVARDATRKAFSP